MHKVDRRLSQIWASHVGLHLCSSPNFHPMALGCDDSVPEPHLGAVATGHTVLWVLDELCVSSAKEDITHGEPMFAYE